MEMQKMIKCQICNKSERGILTYNKKGKEISVCKGCIEDYEDNLGDITKVSNRKFRSCPICKKRLRPYQWAEAMRAHGDKDYQKQHYCQCKTSICEECGKKVLRRNMFCKDCEKSLKAKLNKIMSLLP